MKYSLLLAIAFITYLSVSCSQKPTGEQLAKSYCATCHLYPSPNVLDKKTWKENILPQMAIFMGVELISSDPSVSMFEAQKIYEMGILPTQPMVSKEDWQKIVEYYTQNAPDKLAENPPITYHPLDSLFDIQEFPLAIKPQNSYMPNMEFTLLEYDKKQNLLQLGTNTGDFLQLNATNGKVINQFNVGSPPTDVVNLPNQRFGVTIAGKLEPNHDKGGYCLLTKLEKNQPISPQAIRGLSRPVNMAIADLNQDHIDDIVVCSFGFYTGKLAWYELGSAPNTQPKEHILKQVAGATQVFVKDMNHDKLPDIIALFGQANEGVFVFYNKGNGEFEEKQVLQFPSVYGSIHIELLDYNQDGFDDIVYSNGDNGDKSMIYKPYHGVRIFENDGKNNFIEKYFFPLHGIIKSITQDFDHDGDLDIACISFFPEYEHSPQKSFVFLKNVGKYHFEPYISSKTDVGRWMVMDSFDKNKDGYDDFLLGACYDQIRYSKTQIPVKKLLLLQSRKQN
jgi:FG-GAP-like repeat